VETRGIALSDPERNANLFRLDGKAAVITGAASGIGKAIARQFAASGADVCILDLDEEAAQGEAGEVDHGAGRWRLSASRRGCELK
jgi:NAD(P)-dependent dehydrogenase (short-subunit alcohol dehydrogenase family)